MDVVRSGRGLAVTVFCAGAAVLILEILGARVLAPFFGSSQFVWAALIAVTLLSLSGGYWAGGRLADRGEPLPALHRLLVGAGWLTALVPLARRLVLPAAWALGIRGGSFAAAFVLFAPALLLLGGVAPLAAKAAVGDLGLLGGRVGGLYALSTLGSLAGALLAGYVLVPLAGVGRLLYGTAALLHAPALAYWLGPGPGFGRRGWRVAAGVGLVFALAGALRPTDLAGTSDAGWTVLFDQDGRYASVRVVQYHTSRILMLDGTLQTGLEESYGAPAFPYASAVPALLFAALPHPQRILVVGLGGGVVCDELAARGAAVEAVEIDPVVAVAAKRFFLKRPEMPIHLEDGRTFLRRAPAGSYDAVFLDAYAGEAPPAHLFTREALAQVRRVLAPGGVGMANLIAFTDGPPARLARCVGATLAAVFPWVEARSVERDGSVTNVLYVFGDAPHPLKKLAAVRAHPQVAPYLDGLLDRRVTLAGPDAFVLTDEYAPVEWMNLTAREAMRRNMREMFRPVPWLLL